MEKMKVFAVVMLGVTFLAGCGATPVSSGSSMSRGSSGDGSPLVSVVVHLIHEGGASNSKPGPISGGQVQAVYQGLLDPRLVTATTNADGDATLDVKPGRYLFQGRASTAEHFYCQATTPPVQIVQHGEQPPLHVTVACIYP